ncbi:MAG: M67 family metallopeptidase [Saprospiraceae bacterium]|nr:M67 family metallopeptidase [Saprospiraceae bacterium]
MIVQIKKNVMTGIFDHALADFPNECCGFLYGTEKGQRIIERYEPVNNGKEGDQRRRFAIDPLDYIRAEQQAMEWDTQLVGIYHSHPLHSAIASEHDLAQAMPWFSYVIVSVFPEEVKEIRSFRLDDVRPAFSEEFITH